MVITAKTHLPGSPHGFLSLPTRDVTPSQVGADIWWVVPTFAEYQIGLRGAVAQEIPVDHLDQPLETLYFVDGKNSGWPDFYVTSLTEAQLAGLSQWDSFAIELLSALDCEISHKDYREIWIWGVLYSVNGVIHSAHIEAERRNIRGEDKGG